MPSKTVYYPILWSEKKSNSSQRSGKAQSYQFPEDFPGSQSGSNEGTNLGYWRSSGFGMLCINGLDFHSTSGYPEYKQWGFEDTNFYNEIRYSSNFSVLRFNDPGLVHRWHPKECSRRSKSQHWVFKQMGIPSACDKVKTANGWSKKAPT